MALGTDATIINNLQQVMDTRPGPQALAQVAAVQLPTWDCVRTGGAGGSCPQVQKPAACFPTGRPGDCSGLGRSGSQGPPCTGQGWVLLLIATAEVGMEGGRGKDTAEPAISVDDQETGETLGPFDQQETNQTTARGRVQGPCLPPQ